MKYALFNGSKQISKAHKHIICVWIEAYERKVVMTKIGLESSFSIKEIK